MLATKGPDTIATAPGPDRRAKAHPTTVESGPRAAER